MRKIDLSGQLFGRLKAVSYSHTKGQRRYWLCTCSCGETVYSTVYLLRSGSVKSCGCLANDLSSSRAKIHGKSHTRLHNIWLHMRRRCRSPLVKEYEYYGGRGITICEEWDDFTRFQTWAMGSGYEEHLTIERIDVNGNYCPSNCTWIERSKQSLNTRRVARAPDGEPWIVKARSNGISSHAYYRRLQLGWGHEEAATRTMS